MTDRPRDIRIYRWDDKDHGLLTKRRLSKAGYSTRKENLPPVRGKLKYSKAKDGSGYLDLYDPKEAVPKKPPTDAQKKAHEASKANWRCRECGTRVDYFKKGGGICHQCSIIQWAKDLLETEFVVFDSETTVLHNAEFVQIGVLSSSGETLLDTLIKPQDPQRLLDSGGSGRSAYDIHGIHPDDLVDAPTFPDLYEQIKTLLTGKTVIVYNSSFDIGVLHDECDRHDLPVFDIDSYCAMKAYAKYVGDWSNYHRSYRWYSLSDACRFENIAVQNAHDAIGDCNMTLALIQKLAEESE